MRGAGLGTALGQERPTVKRVSSRSTFTLTGRGARSVHEVRLNVLLGSLTKLHKQSHQEQRGEAERGYQT